MNIDNPIIEATERRDTAEDRPMIEVEFTATVSRRVSIRQPYSFAEQRLLEPGDAYFDASLDDADADKVADTLRAAVTEDGFDSVECA